MGTRDVTMYSPEAYWSWLQARSHLYARERGFWSGEMASTPMRRAYAASLIASEAFEALDAIRKSKGLEAVGTELADVVIRVADLAEEMGIDMAAMIALVQERSAERPALHGKVC